MRAESEPLEARRLFALGEFATAQGPIEGLASRSLNPPVAEITGLGHAIMDGQASAQPSNGTTFGRTLTPGPASVRVYTVTNAGGGVLHLLGAQPVTVTGPGASMYHVPHAPADTSLNPGESTTFTVRFSPTAAGIQAATVALATDDPLNASYTFKVRGAGVAAPRLEVDSPQGDPIANGNSAPTMNLGTGFGGLGVGMTLSRGFMLRNTGLADLSLIGPVSITLSGPGAAQFRVRQPSVLALGPGAGATFVLKFKPTSPGGFLAVVTVHSDDPFVGAYTFSISGVAD